MQVITYKTELFVEDIGLFVFLECFFIIFDCCNNFGNIDIELDQSDKLQV